MSRRRLRDTDIVFVRGKFRYKRPKMRTKEGKDYWRCYCLYENKRGKTKRTSLIVEISPRMTNQGLYKVIRAVMARIIKDKEMPVHKAGQVFGSFSELLGVTPWVKIKKLLRYDPNVEYNR